MNKVPEIEVHLTDTGDTLYFCNPAKNLNCTQGESCQSDCFFTKNREAASMTDPENAVSVSITRDQFIEVVNNSIDKYFGEEIVPE